MEIENTQLKTLQWQPWVGRDYHILNPQNKFLIVGESHYHDGSEEVIERQRDPGFTKKVIQEFAIEKNYYGTKIFPNLTKALFGDAAINSSKFWNLVSFYNLIQRPMHTSGERPKPSDFTEAWDSFFELVQQLEPSKCMFLGTSSADFFNQAAKRNGLRTEGVVWEEFISRSCAKSAALTFPSGLKTELIFIRHPSQRFPWRKWNVFLKGKIQPELDWLEEKSR